MAWSWDCGKSIYTRVYPSHRLLDSLWNRALSFVGKLHVIAPLRLSCWLSHTELGTVLSWRDLILLEAANMTSHGHEHQLHGFLKHFSSTDQRFSSWCLFKKKRDGSASTPRWFRSMTLGAFKIQTEGQMQILQNIRCPNNLPPPADLTQRRTVKSWKRRTDSDEAHFSQPSKLKDWVKRFCTLFEWKPTSNQKLKKKKSGGAFSEQPDSN